MHLHVPFLVMQEKEIDSSAKHSLHVLGTRDEKVYDTQSGMYCV